LGRFGELASEVGSELLAIDAVAELRAAGLVHCCEQFVFPTRAATSTMELSES
jgi:hypothetical protein